MNAFLEACGATGPLVLGVEATGATGTESRRFDRPFALVGRDPRCDLRLDRPEVGDRHAYLQLAGGRLYCLDLGGPGGISYGGKGLRFGRLERERPVRLGPYRIRLQSGDDVPGPTLDDAFPFDALDDPGGGHPRLDLDLRHRSVRRTRHEVRGALALVGSADDCQVRLIDPSVSEYHACLVHTAAGVWVVDLLGQGGIRVNDVDVSYARVHEGDEIRVGRSLIVRPGPEPSTKAAEAPRASAATSAHKPAATPTPTTPAIPARKPIATPAPTTAAAPAPITPATRSTTRLLTTAALSQMTTTMTTTMMPSPTPRATTTTPTPIPTAPLAEPAEAPSADLAGPIESIRRQMCLELRQAQMMLVETFTTLRDEQWAVLNQEMGQLVRMTEELQSLRDEIREQSRSVSEELKRASAPKAPAPTRLGSAASLPTNGHDPSNGNGNGHGNGDHRDEVAPRRPIPIPIPTPPRPSGFGNGRPAWAATETAPATPPNSHELALRDTAERTTVPDEGGPEPVGLHDREAHARLFERIVGGGDDDRRGLWQRLFGS